MAAFPAFFAVLICAYFLYKYLIYQIFLSPLSKIPNAHFTSGFSSLWILWKRYREQENRTIYAAHQKYGPIVRLGTHEVSVNCIEGGLRTIYGGGFEKPVWYPNQFSLYGYPGMFSMMESKPHAVQKRMLSNVYSKSYLQSSLDLAISSKSIVFGRLLPILESLTVQNERVDVHELNFAVAIDFITSYVFGSYNGTNFLEDTKTRKEWLHQYHCRAPYKFWPAEFPKMAPFLRKFKMNLVPRFVDVANEIIEAWCMEMCNATKLSLSKSSQQAHSETLSTSPIVYKQLLGSFLASAQKVELSTSQNFKVASEILDQLGAGFETTGITLTYYIYELSKHPDIQASIRTELLSLSPDLQYPSVDSSLPSPRSIDGLALLDATLMETLRLHAAIPGPQPRKTPSTPTSLVGSPPLPAGIRVSANPHCLHRNKDVFPDPETWRPERWLTDDQASKNEMMRWFWAFGSGSRKCIGSHFATQEIKLVIGAIYTNFKTHIADDDGIEQMDSYMALPRKNRLIIRFERA